MMMPKKPYNKLRAKMFEYGVRQEDIAEIIGKSVAYVSLRFNCKQQFTLSDVYGICRLLEINPKDIHVYFPDGETKSA